MTPHILKADLLIYMQYDPIDITGLTLIEKVLEFWLMTPSPLDWTLEKQEDNPSRFIRLKQLDVLIQVFLPNSPKPDNISFNIESLISGDFILDNKIEVYNKVFLKMDKTIEQSKYSMKKKGDWTLENLRSNYGDLMKFIKLSNTLLDFNNGIMEISYPYLYSVLMTKNVIDTVNLENIYDFLASVIDTDNRTFSKEHLIEVYNYPAEDVYDVDDDNW